MFADLGRFPIKFIQISMGCVVYPAQVTAFSGHASWLRKNMNQVANTFYKSDPDALYMPVFVVVVMVAIIAIQAMIYAKMPDRYKLWLEPDKPHSPAYLYGFHYKMSKIRKHGLDSFYNRNIVIKKSFLAESKLI
ncbi:hypothetical protein R6Q59_023437 [Mikania micrantha]